MLQLVLCLISILIGNALTEIVVYLNNTENYVVSIDCTLNKYNYRLLKQDCMTPLDKAHRQFELVIKNSIKFESTLEKSTDKVYLRVNSSPLKDFSLCLGAFNTLTRKSTFYQVKLQEKLPTIEEIPKIKFLFADSLFANDLTDILHSTDYISPDKSEETTVSESMLEGSFICYILLTNIDTTKSTIKLDDTSDTFELEQVELGSTFVLSSEETPMVKLYSLNLAKKLDFDLRSSYSIKILISSSNIISHAHLRIHVTAHIDKEPKFQVEKYEFDIKVNSKCVGNVRAIDLDGNLNRKIQYFISNTLSYCDNTHESTQNAFEIDREIGEICLADRATCKAYRLQVQAKFLDSPMLISAPAFVDINMSKNINDNNYTNVTIFHTPLEMVIAVDSKPNTSIAQLDITHALVKSEFFSIDSHGSLVNIARVDTPRDYSLKITSNDQDELNLVIKAVKEPDFTFEQVVKYHYLNDRSSTIKLKINITQYNRETRMFTIRALKDGLNCDEKSLKKYFKIRQNGEIYMSKNAIRAMICFVRVELRQYDRLKIQMRQVDGIFLAGDTREQLVSMLESTKAVEDALKSKKNSPFSIETMFGMNFNQFLIVLILSFICVLGILLIVSILLLRKRDSSKKEKHIEDEYNEIHQQHSPQTSESLSVISDLTSSTPTAQIWFSEAQQALDLKNKNSLLKTETKLIQHYHEETNNLIATIEWSPNTNVKNHSPVNSDEGCYGSSDISAVSSLETMPSSIKCGVYHLNTKNSVEDDVDSVLQNNEIILSAKHHLKPALERFEKLYYSSENRIEVRGSFV